MKKVLLILILSVLSFSCKSSKNKGEVENPEIVSETIDSDENGEDINEEEETIPAVHKPTDNPKANKDLLDPTQGVIVVFKDSDGRETETEDLIHEKGLKVEKIFFDQSSLKVGLIKVPADKRDYWLDQLMESGNFKDVKLYSEKTLKELIEKEKRKK